MPSRNERLLAIVRGPNRAKFDITTASAAILYPLLNIGLDSQTEDRVLWIEFLDPNYWLALYPSSEVVDRVFPYPVSGQGDRTAPREMKYMMLRRLRDVAVVEAPGAKITFSNMDDNWYALDKVGVEGEEREIKVERLVAGWCLLLSRVPFMDTARMRIGDVGTFTVPDGMGFVRLVVAREESGRRQG